MIHIYSLESVVVSGLSSGIPLWFWGVIICTISTALTALGFVLQKYSHSRNALQDDKYQIIYYKQPWWLFGFTVYMFAQFVNLASMSMAPQVMLSCLGATALVFNGVFAAMILGEELEFNEVCCMVALLAAVCMVIAASPAGANQDDTTGEQIVGPFATVSFMATAAAIVIVLIMLRLVSLAANDTGFEAIYWALFSAMSSGYTVTLFKALSEMVSSWSTVQPLAQWYFYAILVVALIVAVGQIHTLNLALNMGRAMTIVPAYFCLSMLAQLGVSEAVTLDFPISVAGITVFLTGIALILVFIFFLARAKIAHEEIIVGDEELAFVSAETERDESDENMQKSASTPLFKNRRSSESSSFRRVRCCSAMDAEAFPESFQGKDRTYTVAFTGQMAVA